MIGHFDLLAGLERFVLVVWYMIMLVAPLASVVINMTWIGLDKEGS